MNPAQNDSNSSRSKYYIMASFTMAIWGVAVPVAKATISYIPTFTFLAARFWISVFVTLPFTVWYLRRYKVDKSRFFRITNSALLGYVGTFSFFFLGLERTSAIQSSIMTTFGPPLVSILGLIYLKELINRDKVLGTLIAFVGTLIVIIEPVITGRQSAAAERISLFGNVLVLIGVIFNSAYSIYVKKKISTDKIITPFLQVSISFIVAAVVFTPLAFIEQTINYKKVPLNNLPSCSQGDYDRFVNKAGLVCNKTGCHPTDSEKYMCKDKSNTITPYITKSVTGYIHTKAILGVLYMAVLSGIVAYTLFSLSLKHFEASELSLLNYLQPIFGMPIAILFLKEQLSLVAMLGIALIVFGIYKAEKAF